MKCSKCKIDLEGATRVLTKEWDWVCLDCSIPPIHPAHAQNAGVALRVLGLLLLLVLVFGLLWLREMTK